MSYQYDPGAVSDVVRTTDGSPTVISSVPVAQGKTVTVDFDVNGISDDKTLGASYSLRSVWRNNGGTLFKIGDDQVRSVAKDDPNWGGVSTQANGTSVEVLVDGTNGVTVDWFASAIVTTS